jgi:NO-binding membrane sensor protein with MHYT domain
VEHVSGSYDLVLVSLSFIISVIGSFAALRLAKVIPALAPEDRLPWVLAASFALGAGGIWSMHFIGMLAFDLGMPVSYDVPLTALSLVLAWLVSAVGFFLASRGELTVAKLAGAGGVMGCGVAIMHYTGMAAMRMQADLSYDVTLVTVSVVIAIVASCAALWLALNLSRPATMVAASVVMGVAVTGMHYTGMAAARFTADPGLPPPDISAVSNDFLAYAVFLLSLIIMVLGMTFGRVDAEEELVLDQQ